MQDRAERIRLIIAAASDVEEDTMTDDDWDEMLYLRSQTNAGFLREMEL